ncbi:hypothetical protein [Tenacibaculum ovolyticum]|uniref:hypothetical protein n=1 Tax=Tenacibaculum ovolyticum TaxID=104270 RepID=UPI0007ED8358|nr:hypothetical protein [Tenacibaculum ovolyticum]
MKLFIYGTNIDTEDKVRSIYRLFNQDDNIINVSIDLEDIDNVLRIETTDFINEYDIITKVEKDGFNCIALND